MKFYEKLDIFKKFNNIEEFWKNCKIFQEILENLEEIEELLRKFYAFTSGKSGNEFWCLRNI